MAQEPYAESPRREKIRVIVKQCKGRHTGEQPIPGRIYPVIDTDLGRDNVENDLPAADREELQ